MADCKDELLCLEKRRLASKVQVGATADWSEFEFQIWMNLFGG